MSVFGVCLLVGMVVVFAFVCALVLAICCVCFFMWCDVWFANGFFAGFGCGAMWWAMAAIDCGLQMKRNTKQTKQTHIVLSTIHPLGHKADTYNTSAYVVLPGSGCPDKNQQASF